MVSPSKPNKSAANTPRPSSPSLASVDLSAFPEPPCTSCEGKPAPMAGIDYSNDLPGWNPLPSPSQRAASFAPGSFDSLFLRLQSEFSNLSKEQERLNAQDHVLAFREHAAKAAHKKGVELKEETNKVFAASQRERDVAQQRYAAAVQLKGEIERERQHLEGLDIDLRLREADLEKCERSLKKRETVIQEATGGALEAALAAIGHADSMSQSAVSSSDTDDGRKSISDSLLLVASKGMLGTTTTTAADPPRGRSLSRPEFQEHQLLATTSSAAYGSGIPSRAGEISPLRRRNVVPRRISSSNLSCSTPTPLRVRSLTSEKLRVLGGTDIDSLYDSEREHGAGESSDGGEGSLAGRPRGRSVRRVSRSENLRR